MKHNTSQIRKILDVDPLLEAEKITGKSYKEDEDTSALGMLFHMEHTQKKREILEFAGDTHFGADPKVIMGKLLKYGFISVYKEGIKKEYDDIFEILWHEKKGILLTFETYYGEKSINMIKLYFNAEFKDKEKMKWLPHTSGHFISEIYDERRVKCGSFDGREGLFNWLEEVEEAGAEFLPVWIERPFLWLVNYAEEENRDNYEEINEMKIRKLPENVQKAIEGIYNRGR